MKHFINENWINPSSIHCQVLKRQVAFEKSTDVVTAEISLVNESTDKKIIKMLHHNKVCFLKKICSYILIINLHVFD